MSVPAGFTVISSFAASVAPGGSTGFAVRLDAASAGPFQGTLAFASNDPDENPFDITLYGEVAEPRPEIAVRYTGWYGYEQELDDGWGSVYFERTTVGTPIEKMLTIYNLGIAALTLDAAGLTLPPGYSLASALPSSVEPGGSGSFTIRLDAAGSGAFQGTLSFVNNDADENPYDFTLYGEVAVPQPEIAVRYTDAYGYEHEIYDGYGSVYFGGTSVGTPVDVTLTVYNLGDSALTLDPASVVLPSGFSVVTPFASSVAPTASTTLTVRLDAVSAGAFEGSLSFGTNDPDENPFDFHVAGDVAAPQPEIAVRYTDAYGYEQEIYDGYSGAYFSGTFVGTPVDVTFTVYNLGDGALTLDPASVVLPSGFSVVTPFASSVAPTASTTLTVRLDAVSAGAFDGALSFGTNDADENPFEFSMYGDVMVPQPEIAVRYTDAYGYEHELYDGYSSVHFGGTSVGTPVDVTLTVCNLGTGVLTLDPASVVLPSGFSVVTPFASSVQPAASTTLTVRLDAANAGAFEGSLSFGTNDADENPFDFTVYGEVTAPEPEIAVRYTDAYGYEQEVYDGYSGVDFGATSVGTPVDVTLTIYNLGDGVLTLDPASVVLPAGFSVVTAFASSVQPAASTTLTVRLDAANAGVFEGNLSFGTNDADESPFDFIVYGEVTAPEPEIAVWYTDGYGWDQELYDAYSTADFGTTTVGMPVAQTFTIYNLGSGTMTLDPTSLTLPDGFSLVSSFDSSVGPGGWTTFAIQLDAAAAGQFQGIVSLATNDSDENPFEFTAYGDCVSESGQWPEFGSWYSLETGTSELTAGSSYAVPVVPEINVSCFQLIADGDSTPTVAEGTDFGTANLGDPGPTRTFLVYNTGTGNLRLSSVTVTGNFEVTGSHSFPIMLSPYASYYFTVRLKTNTAETSSGQFSLGNNDSDENPYNFAIVGRVTLPEITVLGNGRSIPDNDTTPSTTDHTDFGTATRWSVGPTRTFTVRNDGDGYLILGPVSVPPNYAVTEGLVSTLSAGQSDTFSVQLQTGSVGIFGGQISFPTNDSNENPFNFSITGTVTGAPEITVSGNAITILDGDLTPSTADGTDFGSATLGSPGPQRTFWVRNEGTGPLTLGAISIPGGFTLTDGLPSTLAVSASDSFTVRLNTTSAGTFAGQISWANNDSDENPFNFKITGLVTGGPEITVLGNGLVILDGDSTPSAADGTDFGTVNVGATGPTRTYTVRNDGSGPLTLGAVQLPPGYTLTEPLVSNLSAGATDTFTVRLNTTTPGWFQGYVFFSNNDSDENPFEFAIKGYVEGPPLQVTINDVSSPEGHVGLKDFTFTVTVSPSFTTGSLVLAYQTINGTALAASDYQSPPAGSTITFTPGESAKTITVKVIGDTRIENDEDFFVTLSMPSNSNSTGRTVTIVDYEGKGTIENDDRASIRIDDVTVVEGNSGDVSAVFTVSMSNPVDEGSVTLSYDTSDQSASAAQPDYRSRSGTVTFAPGETSKTISVPVVGDLADEWNETFLVSLTLHTTPYATLADGTGIGTIIDDDDPGGTPELWRILHKKQEDCCSIICESDCRAVNSKDGGFVQTLLSSLAELPVYFADATYNAAAAIYNFALRLPTGAEPPEYVDVQLDVGTQTRTARFWNSDFGGGATVAFALADDFTALATGFYPLKATLKAYRGTQFLGERTIQDTVPVIDLSESAFGTRWWLPSLDRLFVTTSGIGLIQGDNQAWWFPGSGGSYQTPAGFFGDLSLWAGGYQVRDYQGDVRRFDGSGRLTARVDRNGNWTTYAYDGAGRLAGVTDPTGRATTYQYAPATGLLSLVRDYASRETTFSYDAQNRLTTVTHPDPDTDSANGNTPVQRFTYDAQGRLQTYKDPEHLDGDPNRNRMTTFQYDTTGRYRNSTKPDGASWQLIPSQTKGLTGFVTLADVYAEASDARGKPTKIWHDDFGNATKRNDALNNTSLWTRNSQGRVTQATLPDPDGAGPLPNLVTTYQYDTKGNLTLLTAPDGSAQTWQYDPAFSQVTRHVDELGRETVVTIDPSNGNVTQVTRRGVAGSAAEVALGDPSRPWQNPWNRLDVNHDGYVNAADSLAVTNALNASGSRPLYAPAPGSSPPPYLDATGDNYLSASDVLEVNNALNGATATLTTQYVYTNGSNVPNVPLGLLYEVTDPAGRKTRFEYVTAPWQADFARLARVTYAVGTAVAADVEYGYDSAGNLVWTQDELDRRTDYTYDRRDRLIGVTAPDPDWQSAAQPGPLPRPVARFGYDRVGNLVTQTETYEGEPGTNVPRTTRYDYDSLNRVKLVTSPIPSGSNPSDAPTVGYTYDANGNLLSVTDQRGNVTNYEYDNLNRRWRELLPSPDGAQARPITVYQFDTLGNVTAVVDAKGRSTTYRYDRQQRLVEEKQPDPVSALPTVSTTFVYDAAGQLLSTSDPLGRTTQYAYDVFGRVIREQGPPPAPGQTGPVRSFGYDAAGNLRIAVDGRRNFVEYRYDARDRLVATLDADPDGPGGPLTPSTTSFTYDAASQRLSSVDALSRTTGYQYDRLGRTVLVTAPDPDGGGTQWPSRTSYEYNNFGELATSKQDLQLTANSGVYLITQYAYDRLGRVISTTDPRNAVTGFAYDKAGNRTRVTDPLNNDTVFTYDRLNRLTQEQNELGYTRMNSYDAVNNLTSRTDRNGRTVTYGYDQLDRRTTESWSGTTYVASYTYDLADQLTQASDGVATYGYSYDGLGRATTITHTLAGSGVPGPVTFSQLFDLADNRTRLAATVAGTLDFRSVFTYDGMNRMTRVTQAAQTGGNAVAEKRVDLTYAADSQWAAITRYQDLAGTKLVAASTFTYDQTGRLQGLTDTQNASTLAGFTWTYDTVNRLTAFSSTLYPAESATYTYDAASQLTGADRSGTGGDENYSYDANGNRANYSTGVDNRLQSDGTYNFTYDNEGNRTRRTKITGGEVTEYQWDHRNRLVRVTVRTTDNGPLTKDILYTYDVFDRRVAKQVDMDGESEDDNRCGVGRDNGWDLWT